jgi:hypothetical protein
MKRGRCAMMTHHYNRHGTTTLFAKPFTWTADRDAIIEKAQRGKLALHDFSVAR